MSHIKQLRLVLPEVLPQLRATHATPIEGISVLTRFLQQGNRQRLWDDQNLEASRLEPWQNSLLHALPEPLRGYGFAAAALCWCGEGGELSPGTWMRLELLHLEAGLSDLNVVLAEQQNAEEFRQLIVSLQPLFSLSGFELRCSNAGHWYAWSEQQLDIKTYSIRSGNRSMYEIMPVGEYGASLRRLMTEVQMLLHQHPLNMQREQQGLPAFNAVWFSGAGALELVSQTTTQHILSNESYVQGLCNHLQVSCWPMPVNADELLSLHEEDVVVVVTKQSLQQLDQNWLTPILRAVVAGRIDRLDLHLNQWRVSLQGGRLQQLHRLFSGGASGLMELLV